MLLLKFESNEERDQRSGGNEIIINIQTKKKKELVMGRRIEFFFFTFPWSAVMVRITLTPQFCANVRGIASKATAAAS